MKMFPKFYKKILSRHLPFILTLVGFTIVLFLAVGWFIYKNNIADKTNKSYFGANSNGAQAESQTESKGKANDQPTVYTHPTYGFNLNLPPGFRTSDFTEGEGEVVMISNGKNYQMQIFIKPFKDSENITAAKIRRDIPDLPMERPADVLVGGNPATAFYTTNKNGLKMREIWFTRGENLYQISAKSENDNITGWIMERWSWE